MKKKNKELSQVGEEFNNPKAVFYQFFLSYFFILLFEK